MSSPASVFSDALTFNPALFDNPVAFANDLAERNSIDTLKVELERIGNELDDLALDMAELEIQGREADPQRVHRAADRATKLRRAGKALRRAVTGRSILDGNVTYESGDGAAGDDADHDGLSAPRFAPRFRGNPFAAPSHETPEQARSRARAAIERWRADDVLKESATGTLDRAGTDTDLTAAGSDVRGVAEHIIRFSDPLYVSAFRKYATDPESYVADLTAAEGRVWREARDHMRAALATTGAVLPSPLDPTIVLTSDGVVDPMRQLARVDSTTSKTKRYITSAGSTFSFDAEGAEVSDDTHTETEKTITTHKAQGFIQSSLEVWFDQPNFDSEVAKLIADGKANLEGSKFVNGSGTNEPRGFMTRVSATTSSVVSPLNAETFAAIDVYSVIEALPARHRARARWAAELSTINQVDRFETSNGAKLFPQVGAAESVLLRRPLHEVSAMDAYGDVNTAATADNFILTAGDFSRYVILDRVGLSVYFTPPGQLLNTTTNLPDGRVGWYAVWRTGADTLDANAFRVLNLATTA